MGRLGAHECSCFACNRLLRKVTFILPVVLASCAFEPNTTHLQPQSLPSAATTLALTLSTSKAQNARSTRSKNQTTARYIPTASLPPNERPLGFKGGFLVEQPGELPRLPPFPEQDLDPSQSMGTSFLVAHRQVAWFSGRENVLRSQTVDSIYAARLERRVRQEIPRLSPHGDLRKKETWAFENASQNLLRVC